MSTNQDCMYTPFRLSAAFAFGHRVRLARSVGHRSGWLCGLTFPQIRGTGQQNLQWKELPRVREEVGLRHGRRHPRGHLRSASACVSRNGGNRRSE